MLDLTNKTVVEKSDLKASAIVTLTPKGKFTSGDIQVEIIAVSKIKEGVELFAKAWKGKDQIGFGADGSVDIERFRFFNPPVMVPDGTKKVTILNKASFAGVRLETDNFKYDPLEALKSSLLHAIKLVGKPGADIKAGKIGRTTDTFYPAAGANSPVDGFIYATVTNAGTPWVDCRALSTGSADAVQTYYPLILSEKESSTVANIIRSIFCFNTSTIGTGNTISSATLSLYSGASGNTTESTYPANLAIVSVNPAGTANVVAGDYALANWGTTRFTSDLALSTFVGSSGYHDLSLNANGISNIAVEGVSKFGLRGSNDLDNNVPTARSYGYGYFADQTGATNDPKLVVTYSAASSPNSSW